MQLPALPILGTPSRCLAPLCLQKHGHTHIDELVQHAGRFQNEAILLMHISARYSRGQVVRLLDEKLPPELHSRCTPMLEGW